MTKKSLTFLVIALLGGGLAFLWFFVSTNGKPPTNIFGLLDINEPLSVISMPSDIDEPTRFAMQYQIDQAQILFDQDAQNDKAWVAIGNAYVLFEQWDLAIAAYTRAQDLNSSSILALRNIATVYERDLQDYEKAAEYYELAINQNVVDPTVYLAYGRLAFQRMNDSVLAQTIFERGLSYIPNHPDLLIALIELYGSQGQIDLQQQYAQRLVDTYPDEQKYVESWGHLLSV